MSWLHLLGEDWPATRDAAEVKLYLWREGCRCQRQEWMFELTHQVPQDDGARGQCPTEKSLVLRLETMGFDLRDWRELAGKELRADATWHDRDHGTGEGTFLPETTLDVWEMCFYEPMGAQLQTMAERKWRAHDFIIRFGQHDGVAFPLELEAWLIPEEKFWRREPESPAEFARFGEGPPDLRVMATAYFTDGWVCLPACDDPLALARRTLREEIALEEIHHAAIQWAKRHVLESKEPCEYEQRRDWPPTVHFRTEPGEHRRRRGTREE